jgi:phosphate starvation-inducible PhoH-like protein
MTKKQREINERKTKLGQVYFQAFHAKTEHQQDYVVSVAENDVTIVNGVSGSGKSYISIGLACQYLVDGKIDNILYSRSIVSCEDTIGFLKGDLHQKVEPYFQGAIDYFNHFLGKDKVAQLINYGVIKIHPVELLRGHNYNNSLMVLDESQSANPRQIKLFLSRMGKNSKAIIAGDVKQSDLSASQNGLRFMLDKFQEINKVSFIELTNADILRHDLLGELLNRFDSNGI